ncbi:MAG: hypothetical protein IKB99_01320 [Lentisphaeria bacterium]|nr:hypothetical protein [Lentisphaeria bacterium]
MSKVIENKFIRLEFGNDGKLLSFCNLTTGTELVAPHGLWRLVCNCGDSQEIELSAERSTSRIAVAPRKFKIEYRTPVGSNGETLDVKVAILGQLVNEDLHMMITVFNGMTKDNIIKECHFPLLSLSEKASHMTLHTSERAGTVWPDLVSAKGRWRNYEAIYQGKHYLYERRVTRYPGSEASMNFFELNSGTEGIYFGNHDESFQCTCHLIEDEKPGKLNLGMVKLPFLGAGNQVTYENFVISAHTGTWHKGADKYRAWAEKWFKFREHPESVRQMFGWQRLIMRSQYGENFYTFEDMEKICDEGKAAGIDTLLMFGWHAGGHDNDYPNYVVSPSLGGKAMLQQGIEAFHNKGCKVILYSNGQLIDHNSDFYRYGNGKNVATKDPRGNEHIQTWGFSGNGIGSKVFGGRTFSRACPSSREFFGILKKFVDFAAEVGADGVFFDQLGSGDQLCCDSGHGHAVPFTTIMEARSAMLAKLHTYAENKNLSLGIENVCDVTAQHSDYIHSCPGGANPVNPNWEEKGEKPQVLNDFSLFRYVFPEMLLSNRDIRDEKDMIRRCNYMLVQNLLADVEVYRCQRSIGTIPAYQEYLGKVNDFREKHSALLRGALFRSDADYTASSAEFYTAGHRTPEGDLVIMATLSHLDKCKCSFEVPGYDFDSADILGEGKVDKNGTLELKRFGVALLKFTPKA